MTSPDAQHNRFRPIQIIHTFEGLANGLEGIEVMPTFGRPRPLELHDFESRVRTALEQITARGVGGVAVNVGHDEYLESEAGWARFIRGLEIAVELGLRIWIYDENGYPSGSAGGLSLRGHPELEAVGADREVLFPSRGHEPLTVRGSVELNPYECLLVFQGARQ